MPEFAIEARSVDISRRAVVLDTNVLVAAFCDEEQYHDEAKDFLEQPEAYEDAPDQMLVPSAVAVETWGMIVGRGGRRDRGERLVEWLLNPGGALLMPEWNRLVEMGCALCKAAGIDIVDGVLFTMAHVLTQTLSISPPLRVATFDSRDYVRCGPASRFRLSVRMLDLRSNETY